MDLAILIEPIGIKLGFNKLHLFDSIYYSEILINDSRRKFGREIIIMASLMLVGKLHNLSYSSRDIFNCFHFQLNVQKLLKNDETAVESLYKKAKKQALKGGFRQGSFVESCANAVNRNSLKLISTS